MSILPPSTRPWDELFERSHTPKLSTAVRGYQSYRPCLRWDFGFSCAFCLLHESDLNLGGAGAALMETEHFVPISHVPALENRYSNCFYICHFCNHSRGEQPNHEPSGQGRLLNPCLDIWSEHFILEEDRLHFRDKDPDAVYTRDAYDLNDERKVRMRKLRREILEDFAMNWDECRRVSDGLLGEFMSSENSSARRLEMLDKARSLRGKYKSAHEQLFEYFGAIPWNAPQPCRCEPPRSTPLALPLPLAKQTLDLDPVVDG
jgi:hypothetical protein